MDKQSYSHIAQVQIAGVAHQVYVEGPLQSKACELVRAAFAPNSRVVTLPAPRDGYEWVQSGPCLSGPDDGHVQYYWEERARVRAYDWSKTDPTVLVEFEGDSYRLYRLKDVSVSSAPVEGPRLPTIWQHHDGSDTPQIDVEACEYEVEYCETNCEAGLHVGDHSNAGRWGWCQVTGWRFIRLRDGYVWSVE